MTLLSISLPKIFPRLIIEWCNPRPIDKTSIYGQGTSNIGISAIDTQLTVKCHAEKKWHAQCFS